MLVFYTDYSLQMLMNVKQCQVDVMLTLIAPTLMGVMNALATVGTLEMGSHAQVCRV